MDRFLKSTLRIYPYDYRGSEGKVSISNDLVGGDLQMAPTKTPLESVVSAIQGDDGLGSFLDCLIWLDQYFRRYTEIFVKASDHFHGKRTPSIENL
jgi:hypothetical protein